jgi:DNA-binding protein
MGMEETRREIQYTDSQERNQEGRENIIYIGRKPTMNYVLAVVTQFNSGMDEVAIKARGNSISKAVDVKEIVINRFMPALKERSIKTSSEDVTNEDGTRSKVSAIQIVLGK